MSSSNSQACGSGVESSCIVFACLRSRKIAIREKDGRAGRNGDTQNEFERILPKASLPLFQDSGRDFDLILLEAFDKPAMRFGINFDLP